jgi:hypothetical protein
MLGAWPRVAAGPRMNNGCIEHAYQYPRLVLEQEPPQLLSALQSVKQPTDSTALPSESGYGCNTAHVHHIRYGAGASWGASWETGRAKGLWAGVLSCPVRMNCWAFVAPFLLCVM